MSAPRVEYGPAPDGELHPSRSHKRTPMIPPVAGRRYWVLIWYGILMLGIAGLVASIYWGRQTHYRNLDEIFRGIGTICASIGMVLLLSSVLILLGEFLLILSVAAFVAAFILGRKIEPQGPPHP